MIRWIAIANLTLLFGGLAATAEHPKPPLEAYGALPQISSAEISPDGTKIAAIVNLPDVTRMAIIEIGGTISQQVGIDKIKARGVEFFDNDHVILRLSKTTFTHGFRGDYEYSAAFSINIESLEINQLLERTKNLFPAQSGLGRIVGRGANPGEILMPAYLGDRYSDPKLELLVTKLGSKRGSMHQRGTTDTIDWFVGDDGEALARERYDNQTDQYRVQWRRNNNWEDVYSASTEIPDMAILGVTPDETGLVFIRENGTGELAMKLGSDGQITGPLIPANDREIDRIYTDSNRKFLGVRYAGQTPDYAFLDEDIQDSFDKISAQLPNATIYLDSWSDNRNKLLYQVFDPALNTAWIVHTRDDNHLGLIAHTRPDIPAAATGYMMNVTYKARDGLEINAIVTLPPDFDPDTSGAYPSIILPHGGPASYDGFDFDWMAQYFANRGYAVVQPNFRGSTGFGSEFRDAGRGEWGSKMQDDITDGVDALANSGIIDRDRVCIAGASYGGYAALAGAVFTPDLYKCVIAIAPVSDLNLMLSDSKKRRGSDHWVISYWEDVMAEGDARKTKLKAISPVHFVDQVTAPVLLLHGNDDTVVPYNQSKRMERALRRAGKSVELIKLKGEDHWLSVADTRLQTLREMDRFIAEHVPITE